MKKKLIILAVAWLAVVILDRWLKNVALAGVEMDFPFGQFVLVKNYGIIFSWPVPNLVAIVFMVFAVGVVSVLLRDAIIKNKLFTVIGCVSILLGAGSNIFDRLAYGYVIDWAYLGPWWPIFNMADVMVISGLILLLTSERLRVD